MTEAPVTEAPMTEAPLTERAETALFSLLADRPFLHIRLAEIAERADVPLADLRRAYESPFDVLSGFARRIDVAVLEARDPAMAGEPVKDRLFDVLMKRFDLLGPHRAGLAGLRRSARRDPLLAVHLARLVIGSQAWMLEASGVSAAGPKGVAKSATLAAALARVVPVFLDETDAGLPKTMAALDAALDRLGRLAGRVRRIEETVGRVFAVCRRDRREKPSVDAADVAIDPAI
ncbi:MAG: TetR/AcrR family transcriptional regulator [Hyphomicrobiales bacterium]|nr:TetR/AcrR family transcriptional regulator [Hyphomicrobiales bacterium]